MMKKIFNFTIILLVFITTKTNAQSTNCTTATNLSLNNGTTCVNGTSSGAVTDNILYGNCNTVPVNMVWYTYVTNGSNNSFTITPGTLTNAEIVIYQGGCPNTGTLQTCVVANGSTPIVTSWGMTAGVQTWIGIASNNGVSGSFNFCVNSQPPAVGAGNTCAQAIPICTLPYTKTTIPSNSSGQLPTCFGSAPQQDIWIKFTIKQAGLLAWKAMPTVGTTEFDWCLWDITGGCPGSVACCNYNYAAGSSAGFGMQAQTGTVACGFGAFGTTANEYCGPMNVTCGKIYAIQISNYSNNNTGFTLTFPGATCLITSNASFAVTPTLTCGASLNASINNLSTGACTGEVWTFGDGSPSYNGLTPPAHTYTAPGTYAITASIGGVCPSTASQFVQLLAPLAATVAPTPINCAGNCTGSATVTGVSGGDGIYTYLWNNGNTTPNVSGLCAGVYSVTISNVICGTSITKTVNIIAPPALTLTTNPTNATCGNNNGSILVSGSGGTAPYQFSINGGLFSATTNFTGLFAGTYTMALKDLNNCQTTVTVVITQTPPPVITVSSATTCPGVPITLTAAGGTTYTWSPATGLSSTNGTSVTATVATVSSYTVTGTFSGCTGTAVAVVSMFAAPTPSASSNSPVCAGTPINLIGSGGLTYTWTGPSTYTSNTQSPTIVSAVAGNGGTYTLTVTDVNGCKNFTTTAVVVNPLPIPIANNTGPFCVGTTINLTGGGGGTYSWTGPAAFSSALQNPTIPASTLLNAGTYSLLVTLNTCTAIATTNVVVSTASTTASNTGPYCAGTNIQLNAPIATTYTWSGPGAFASNIQNPVRPTSTTGMSGTYTVIVSIGTCTASATTSVTVNALPTPTASNTGPYCPNGTIQLNLGAFTSYTWNGPASFSSNLQNPSITLATTAMSGNYSVSVTNANGCTNTSTTTIVVNPNPTPIIGSNSPICMNTNINLTSGGGASYSWNGPSGFISILQNPTVINSNTTNAGVYTVTVTSAAGCTATNSINVSVLSPSTTGSNTGPYCAGAVIQLNTPAASSYTWSGPSAFASNLQNPVRPNSTTAMSGNYTVIVSIGSCTTLATTSVTVNALPTPIANSNNPICTGADLNLTGTGGATYSWTGPLGFTTAVQNPTITNALITNAGVYSLTVIDANGCQASTSTSVTINPSPTLLANGATVCFGYPATLTATGGVTYSWVGPNGFTSNLQNPTLPVVNNNTTGNYTVTITGVNTCTSASAVNVGTYPLPVPTITSTAKTCINTPVNLQGSTGFLMYQWTGPNNFLSPNSATSFTPTSITQSGMYTLSVTDNRGCVGSTSTLVVIDPLPNASVFIDKNKKCVPFCSNFSLQNAIGSASLVTASWFFNGQSFNGSTLNYCVTNAGDYLIKANFTDANGCSNSTTYTLNAYPIPTAMFEYSPAKPLEVEDEVKFTDGSMGPEINSWHWYFISNSGYQSTSQNPFYTFEKSGTYPIALVVTNKWGCSDTTVKTITVGEGNSFYVPNAFTPNGDGINDTFFAKGYNVSKFEMRIFDRWGEQLFHTNELAGEWNGTYKGQDCKDDVYVWKISVTMQDAKVKTYTGHVTINR